MRNLPGSFMPLARWRLTRAVLVCVVGGVPPEIGVEALVLPTSRQLMAVGHDYYQKAPMKMNISHGGVCICMLGVLLSCDPAAYVQPVAHASSGSVAAPPRSIVLERSEKND